MKPGGQLRRVPFPARTVPLERRAVLEARTPLIRTSGIPRASREGAGEDKGAARTKGRAVGAASGAPKPPGEFTLAVKHAVRRRAGRGDAAEARCEGCGRRLGARGGQVHHRAGRGSGGCRDEVIQGCANALLLCGTPFDGCHGAATAFDAHLGMDGAGLWIRHGTTPEFDPRNVQIMLHDASGGGMPVWLAEDGLGPDGTGYLYQCPEVEAA